MSDYLIWSNEHRAWWAPGRAGYARRVEQAGRYSREDALGICADAIPGTMPVLGMPPELPVREEDVVEFLLHFFALYPGHDPEPQK